MSLLVGECDTMRARTPADRMFDPDATHAMGLAFVSACWALGPAGKSSEVKTRVALVIVDLAARGERNAARLRVGALRSIVG
jgi:hypothetical protein